jgi:tetratricopeptide (TPR) repeat protein
MVQPDESGRRYPRAYIIAALVAAVAVPLCAVLVLAQSSRRAAGSRATPLQAAERALIEGRHDEVDGLTAALDARDPNVVAIRARAALARGRYAEAEAMLTEAARRDPSSAAALELGLLQKQLRRGGADATLERVAELAATTGSATEMARAARALQALGEFEAANRAFREAAGARPADVAINAAWGDLFLEKYNKPEALKSYQAALEADARWTPALVGLARTLADDNPPQAIAAARRALEINPSSVEAMVFLAAQAVDADRRQEARELLDKALDVNPSSLEARAMLAAMAYVEDQVQAFEAEVGRVLAIAPGYGDVYRVAGELAAHNYRFEEAVVLTRKALEVAPGDPRALAELGTHLLRTGDEPDARRALEASFRSDPYNVVTFNLLGMLDALDKFETIEDGEIVLKMTREEAPVLKEFVLSLAHRALDTMAARYEFRPRGPILIEVFPKHDDFAVRNVGLPGMIGALGACFGRVVTMDSPRARPGEFQWEATLWHELGHVITLQMSHQRVPRWLTEGISEYESIRERREWGRQMELTYAGLLDRGQTLKLADLNAAFQDPKTIGLAYYEASLVVDYLVGTVGQAGLNRLLRAYGRGLDTDAALEEGLDTDFDRLQAGFDQAIERRFGDLRRALAVPKDVDLQMASPDMLKLYAQQNPRSYPVQMAFAEALREAGDFEQAAEVFERAAALVPVARGDDSPHAQLADIAIQQGDRRRAITELTALVDADFDNLGAARKLASLLREEGVADPARLRPVYERIVSIDPFDADAQGVLGRIAIQQNRPAAAAERFRTVIALGPVDPAAAHTDLAESYFRAGRRADAKRQTITALEIAPSYERAQNLLLALNDGRD